MRKSQARRSATMGDVVLASVRTKCIGAILIAAVGLIAHLSTYTIHPDGRAEITPSSNYFIPNDELRDVMAAADKNELPAIRRLIDHWGGYVGDREQADAWKKRARELGDQFELRSYAYKLLSQARHSEQGVSAKRALLGTALAAAERVLSLEKTDENAALVREIRAERGGGGGADVGSESPRRKQM